MKYLIAIFAGILLTGLAMAGVSAPTPPVATGGINDEILLEIEEPSVNASASGVANLRGWAVAPAGISRIELYTNGEFAAEVPYGGARDDVERVFPLYPNSGMSGYSMAYGYSNLDAGPNNIRVRAYDNNGDYVDKTIDFNVEKFNADWIPTSSSVNLNYATAINVVDGNRLQIQSALINGREWDVTLKWQTATQGFDIEEIILTDPSNPRNDNPLVGTWVGNATTIRENGEYCILRNTLTFIDDGYEHIGARRTIAYGGTMSLQSTVINNNWNGECSGGVVNNIGYYNIDGSIVIDIDDYKYSIVAPGVLVGTNSKWSNDQWLVTTEYYIKQ